MSKPRAGTLGAALARVLRARQVRDLQRAIVEAQRPRGSRDRSLPGKRRIKARKAAQRAERAGG